MNARHVGQLDPRTWIVWGIAASLPPLLGRNPFALAATLLAVLGVRAAWMHAAPRAGSWRGIVRLAALFAVIGAVFNVLTVRAGDRPFAHIRDDIPIIGGALTTNALVYGVLSGAALLTLVLVGTTVGVTLDWSELLRLLPARLATVAVAGSVAWAFIPQTAAALREIREAQAARGHKLRGPRDLVPLLVPLLTGGLERAITLAEALESRAFGAPLGAVAEARPLPWREVVVALGLAGGASGGYLLAVGQPLAALGMLIFAGFGLTVAARSPRGNLVQRTRYRAARWSPADSLVTVAAGVAAVATLVTVGFNPAALRYEPYPSLTLPHVNLLLLAGLALLLVPVIVAPTPAQDNEVES